MHFSSLLVSLTMDELHTLSQNCHWQHMPHEISPQICSFLFHFSAFCDACSMTESSYYSINKLVLLTVLRSLQLQLVIMNTVTVWIRKYDLQKVMILEQEQYHSHRPDCRCSRLVHGQHCHQKRQHLVWEFHHIQDTKVPTECKAQYSLQLPVINYTATLTLILLPDTVKIFNVTVTTLIFCCDTKDIWQNGYFRSNITLLTYLLTYMLVKVSASGLLSWLIEFKFNVQLDTKYGDGFPSQSLG